jgi:hypothetical protein
VLSAEGEVGIVAVGRSAILTAMFSPLAHEARRKELAQYYQAYHKTQVIEVVNIQQRAQ